MPVLLPVPLDKEKRMRYTNYNLTYQERQREQDRRCPATCQYDKVLLPARLFKRAVKDERIFSHAVLCCGMDFLFLCEKVRQNGQTY